MTGKRTQADFTFSSLRLGDSEATILEVLGPPAGTVPVEEVGGVLWRYWPMPFSLEVVDGQLYSIRVTGP